MNFESKKYIAPAYWPWIFSGLVFLAYTWSAPFRDLYSLEARNALIAKEMLEQGLSLVPTVMGRPYPDYPPLYFWLEVLFSWPFGHITTFSAVLPSAMAASGLVTLGFYLGREISLRAGWLTAVVLATSPGFWLNGSRASIDMLLALGVGLAIFFLYRGSKEKDPVRRQWMELVAVLAMTAAFFSKGPIGLVLPGGIWGGYLFFERQWRNLVRFILIMAILGLICVGTELLAAWHQGGIDLVNGVIKGQVTGRVGKGSNQSIFYYPYYLLRAIGPWWLWAIAAAISCLGLKRGSRALSQLVPRHPVSRLALVWFILVFCLFSLASSRHGRYLLPVFPAIALLISVAIDRSIMAWETRPLRGLILSLDALFAISILSAWAIYLFLPMDYVHPLGWMIVWSCAISLGWVLIQRLCQQASRPIALTALLMATGLSGFSILVEPALSRQESGRPFVQAAESMVTQDIPVVLYRIHPDKNGVKYALYSQRLPDKLRFCQSYEGLESLKGSYMLVGYRRDIEKLRDFFKRRRVRLLTKGLIHRKEVVAYLVPERKLLKQRVAQ